MRVKDTLNLGKTKFKMRGNLPVKEVDRQKAWDENHMRMVIFIWAMR
jgi:isoleucyl-tRNA synthetase